MTQKDQQTGYKLLKFLSLKGEGVYWLWEALFDSGPDLVKRVPRRTSFAINTSSSAEGPRIHVSHGNQIKGGRRKQLTDADSVATESIRQAHDDWTDKQIAEFFDKLMSGDSAYASPDTVRPTPLVHCFALVWRRVRSNEKKV